MTSCRCPEDRLKTHRKEPVTDSETTKPAASRGRNEYRPEKWHHLQPETRKEYMALDLINQHERSTWEHNMLLGEKKKNA